MARAIDLHVEMYGVTDPAIVLMHGFAGSARNFGPQARALKSRHRVVLFDARGHARSEAPEDPDEYDPEAFVEDAGRVIAQSGARSIILGGISMGAGIALRYALLYPHSLRGLVLASFPPPESSSPTSWPLALARAIEERGLESAGEEFVWGGSRFDAESAKWIRKGFLEHRPDALVAVLRRVLARQPAPAEMESRLKALSIPTLVIAGERDVTSVAPSRDLARFLPNARLVLIEGGGHVLNLEKTESFNDALSEFSSGVEA